MLIKNTIQELIDLKDYYLSPVSVAKRYKYCFTGVRNFSIDEYGQVKLCFGMSPIGDLGKQTPQEIWNSDRARELREVISRCQKNCRILPCNKRESFRQLVKIFFRKFV